MPRVAPIHPPARVAEVCRQALDITAELEPPDDLRVAVFTQAAGMLANVIVEPDMPAMLPAMHIPSGRH